jgi:hypothetical protein
MINEHDLIRRGDASGELICRKGYGWEEYLAAIDAAMKDIAALSAVTPDLCADARSRPDQEISNLHSRIAVLEADGTAARKAAAESYARANAAEAQLAERDAAIAAAYEAATGVACAHYSLVRPHHPDMTMSDLVAQGYGNAALNIGHAIRALTPSAALAALERVKAEARGDVAGLVEALKTVIDACDQGRMIPRPGSGVGGMTIDANIRGSVYTNVAAWPIEEARAALAAWEGRE